MLCFVLFNRVEINALVHLLTSEMYVSQEKLIRHDAVVGKKTMPQCWYWICPRMKSQSSSASPMDQKLSVMSDDYCRIMSALVLLQQ